MSRIGVLPISLPKGVEVVVKDDEVLIKGPLGQITQKLPEGVSVKVENQQIIVQRKSDEKQHKANHGLTRALLNNHVLGVTKGWTKRLQLVGVGYRANLKGNTLVFTLGFSHEVQYELPKDVKATVDQQVKIELTGIDKQKVGQVAATIRALKPPEPYKGKGIKYEDEEIRRKAGKTGKGK
ncbi:MAG: 50S ribosomal protein L6 [Leptospiraceae bacterium]|nr:50S ribosomal protein L6 [Leptospiraceae bacterium]MDW7975186.1 50S ribosomal protein L6 [Leptospiraceae bacterium]